MEYPSNSFISMLRKYIYDVSIVMVIAAGIFFPYENPANAAVGDVIASYNMENGVMPGDSNDTAYRAKVPIKLLTDPNGNRFIRITASPEDNFSTSGARSEVNVHDSPDYRRDPVNRAVTYELSVRIPTDGSGPAATGVLQFFQYGGINYGPALRLLWNEQRGFWLRHQTAIRDVPPRGCCEVYTTVANIGRVGVGEWAHFRIYVYWTTEPSRGVISVWVNGRHAGTATGLQTVKNPNAGPSDFRIGSYSGVGAVEFDNLKMTVGSPGQIPSSTPNPTPTPTNAPPAITLTATPSSLSTAGQGTQLLWAVQNATSCTASGGWSGSKNPQGGNERHTPPQSTVYTLTCQGPGGTSQKSVTVTVGAAGSCSKYSAGATLPAGYGAPWDVTNPGTLLLNADCAPPNILLKVRDNNMLRYIFKNAHIASSGAPSWTAVNLFGSTPASESWYKGSAQGVANIQSLATPAYYLAYTCAWKCGCRDTACTQSYWQIQKLQQ